MLDAQSKISILNIRSVFLTRKIFPKIKTLRLVNIKRN